LSKIQALHLADGGYIEQLFKLRKLCNVITSSFPSEGQHKTADLQSRSIIPRVRRMSDVGIDQERVLKFLNISAVTDTQSLGRTKREYHVTEQ
jgi:hypothetical protein